jgi:hypothetical protein
MNQILEKERKEKKKKKKNLELDTRAGLIKRIDEIRVRNVLYTRVL